MPKSAEAFRTISEVAEWLETPAHVLRFWESKFAQIRPVKRAGGRRYYRPADMELLGGIKRLLHDEGMTIKGVQKMLRDHGVAHVAAMSSAAAVPDDTPTEAEIIEIPTAVLPPLPETTGSGASGAGNPEGEASAQVMVPPADAPDLPRDTLSEAEPAPASPTAESDPAPAPVMKVAEDVPQAPSILDSLPEDPADDALPVPDGVLALLLKRGTPLTPDAARQALDLARKLAAGA
ncbi:MerR family transcriptional regulator [Pseudooceanicola algae]|uniref:Uncharacterized protein n=1 Tax=Pseudooceanicola algae TaxID=1537215 RepID=A0A418SDQ4_9RHOB|nr:MerR family transcriptional regulator [Pseudooceanicola algae]QPM89460.1 hypothetical protein PSAL_006800 [Pseudooceanicola algae]